MWVRGGSTDFSKNVQDQARFLSLSQDSSAPSLLGLLGSMGSPRCVGPPPILSFSSSCRTWRGRLRLLHLPNLVSVRCLLKSWLLPRRRWAPSQALLEV